MLLKEEKSIVMLLKEEKSNVMLLEEEKSNVAIFFREHCWIRYKFSRSQRVYSFSSSIGRVYISLPHFPLSNPNRHLPISQTKILKNFEK